MVTTFKKQLVLLFCVCMLAALAGCGKAKELGKYKDQAVALAGKYGPQLSEYSKKLPDLLSRAKSLPVNLPGVSNVTKLLEDNKGYVDKLQGLVADLPTQVASKPGDAKATLESAEKDLSAGVKSIGDNVTSAETQLTDLEAKAKAGAASGSGTAAGSGAAAGSGSAGS